MSIKNEDEIYSYKKIIKLTMDTHSKIEGLINSGCFEIKEIQKIIDRTKKKYKLKFAFTPIISYDTKIPDLHYKHKNEIIPEDSLILVDIGYKNIYSCSDITRCYNITSIAKQNLYIFVKNIQNYVISIVKSDISFNELEYLYTEEYIKNLVNLGIIEYDSIDMETKIKVKKLFQSHTIGHSVSSNNVHEEMNSLDPLRQNMIITIEPGIYFSNNIEEYLELLEIQYNYEILREYKKHGGTRIEDMFLITEKGCIKL